ncbi:MAG: PD-(D/E)XK nuclease family protein [Candidatus Izemoplasmatales bacterium]|nr:PD-(D/E)XK nuclease family protein [Candidatus Izemoplasmatales bacterium]
MKDLTFIKNNSLLIATEQDKLEVLNYLSKNSIFLTLQFLKPNSLLSVIDKTYPFYIKEHFSILPVLSERMKKYFDHISIEKDYDSDKINRLKNIKIELIKEKIYKENKRNFSNIYSVNNQLIPNFIKHEHNYITTADPVKSDIIVSKCLNQIEQCLFAYEWVVNLLEKGVNLNKINILNSTNEDDLQLKKLFKDANIPYNIFKRTPIVEYPLIIELINVFKNESYDKTIEYLNVLKQNDFTKRIYQLFNLYPSSLIESNKDVFIHELKKISVNNNQIYKEAISINSFDNFFYQEDEYYLLMNYYDEFFPKKFLDNDYLSDEEVKEIAFPTSIILNKNLREVTAFKLDRINNLTLSYPIKVVDETMMTDLPLTRKIIDKSYVYAVKEYSYLNDLLYLDYSKKITDYKYYNLSSPDLILLNNTFKGDYQRFIPEFTGIDNETLKYLLSKNSTLSATKIESYNLCPFKYYLNYLLRINTFEENIFSYIGNIIHRVLELYVKEKTYDIDKVFSEFNFPKSEEYKFKIFKEIIKENIEFIHNIVSTFEEVSHFKEVYSEEPIHFKFNEHFYLTGKIDKVMVDDETKYFIIIDYKYGDHNYSTKDIDKDYIIQLPFYLYAYKHQHPNLKPAGILYQQTSLIKEVRSEEKTHQLKGVVVNLETIVRRIDPSLSYIKGVREVKNGLAKSDSTLVDQSFFTDLYQKAFSVIEKTSEEIVKGNFSINPVLKDYNQLSSSYVACSFCPYEAICYSKNKHLGGKS